MAERGEKLLVGGRVRRLRQTLGLTQAQMADDLDVSPSYVNLIERNQRPISAKLLLKLATVYDFDVAALASSSDAQTVAELYEVMRDPALDAPTLSKNEVEDMVGASPAGARAMLRLYSKYRDLALHAQSPDLLPGDREQVEVMERGTKSVEAVRHMLYDNRNYFPELDEAAEALADELGLRSREPNIALTERLKSRHKLSVLIIPMDVMPDKLRYFNRHLKRIELSELLRQSGRRFQLAFQLGMLEFGDLIRDIAAKANLPDREAEGLARVNLANYFAAALLMPYTRFLQECEKTKYDVELLSHRFGASYEQTAHRLTTLQKPEARGVPFFFVRMDRAGNVSKRFSAGRFHFSKFGGACPLWNIHECFQTPGRVHAQMIEMPDETRYLSIARTVERADGTYDKPPTRLAIGLGCDVSYAPRLIYARGYDLETVQPTQIGVNCYLCERPNCPSRAHAPLGKRLSFDERSRGMSIFRFDSE